MVGASVPRETYFPNGRIAGRVLLPFAVLRRFRAGCPMRVVGWLCTRFYGTQTCISRGCFSGRKCRQNRLMGKGCFLDFYSLPGFLSHASGRRVVSPVEGNPWLGGEEVGRRFVAGRGESLAW